METTWCRLIGNLMIRNQGESLRAQSRRILKTQIEVQFRLLALALVPLLAGNLAGATSDALGDVDERCLDWGRSGRLRRHALLPLGPDSATARSFTFTTLTRHALVS